MELNIFTVLVLCGVFYLGYLLGESITIYKLRHSLRNLARSVGLNDDHEFNVKEEAPKVQVSKLYQLQTETHGDMIYLFDKEHDEFICQAKTLDELARLAKENKKIVGAFVTHGDQILIFADGKCEGDDTQCK